VLNDISAAIEGLDQAHRDIIARIGRDEERFEKIAAQINFLTVQSRIAHPWTINALSALEGESFVSTAYKIIVQRDASEREVSYFMNLLERGEEKLKILTHLCESPEVRNLDSREDKQDSRIEYLASAIEGIDASKIGERGGKA
jgi:hypothetical protein